MKKIYTQQVSYTDTLEYEFADKCVAVRLESHKLAEPRSFFISKSDWTSRKQRKSVSLVDWAIKIERPYLYPTPKFWKIFDKVGFSTDKVLEMVWGYNKGIDPFDAIKLNDFNPDNLVYFHSYDHSLFKLDSEIPMSIPMRRDYIGGVTNRDYDLKKAQAILESNPSVWDVKAIDIPYFNHGCSGGDKAIEFTVKLPQDQFDEVFNYLKQSDYKNEEVKDLHIYRKYFDKAFADAPFDIDLLGLKDAYIGEPE